MRFFLFILILLFSCKLDAVPYRGNIIQFKQPDGSRVEVKLFGDEFYIRAESVDGYTLIRDELTQWICYATVSDDGQHLISTGQPYTGLLSHEIYYKNRLISRHQDIRDNVRLQNIALQKSNLQSNSKELVAHTRGTPLQTVKGNIKGLCILVDFPDEPATLPVSEFHEFCNNLNYSNYDNNGSLRTFYRDISGGLLDYENVVFGFYHAPKNFTYYDSLPYATGARMLLDSALRWIHAQGFDFSSLSLNNDHSIRAINLMYTGVPLNWAKGMWHHKGNYTGFEANGIRSNDYNCSPAYAPLKIATIAHENGHMIGKWPDTYKYTTTNGDDGIGTFDLMCWPGNDGGNPVPPNPLFRSNAGWGRVIDINEFNGIVYDTANAMTCYRYYNINDSNEFFLLENREKTARSTQIEDEGLTIWHIDRNGNNQTTHHEVFLEHANNDSTDNSKACFKNGFNNEFTEHTLPSSRFYNGDPSALRVTQISNQATIINYKLGSSNPQQALRLKYAYLSNDDNANGTIDQGEHFRLNLHAINLGQLDAQDVVVRCEALGEATKYVEFLTQPILLEELLVQQSTQIAFDGTIKNGTPLGTDLMFRFTISNGLDSIYITKHFITGPLVKVNNQSVSLCNALHFDDGYNAVYADNKDYIQTLLPLNAWNPVQLEFLNFELEASNNCEYDYLEIFNGKDTTSTKLGKYCGSHSPGKITSSDTSGALTLHFHSDEGVSANGWKAKLSCKFFIEGTDTLQVDVFPNPVHSFFSVRTYSQPIMEVNVIDMMGKVVFSTSPNRSNEIQIDTRNFRTGFFIVEVKTESSIERRKMLLLN